MIARKIGGVLAWSEGGWQRGAIEDSDRGWWRRRGVLGWKLPRSPAGDLELVIKYKEACFASSRMESARVRRLFPFRLPSRLLASPFRYARNTERAVFNSRLHSIYFESWIRRCRTWSERPSDAISAIAEKSHPTFLRASRPFEKKDPIDTVGYARNLIIIPIYYVSSFLSSFRKINDIYQCLSFQIYKKYTHIYIYADAAYSSKGKTRKWIREKRRNE